MLFFHITNCQIGWEIDILRFHKSHDNMFSPAQYYILLNFYDSSRCRHSFFPKTGALKLHDQLLSWEAGKDTKVFVSKLFVDSSNRKPILPRKKLFDTYFRGARAGAGGVLWCQFLLLRHIRFFAWGCLGRHLSAASRRRVRMHKWQICTTSRSHTQTDFYKLLCKLTLLVWSGLLFQGLKVSVTNFHLLFNTLQLFPPNLCTTNFNLLVTWGPKQGFSWFSNSIYCILKERPFKWKFQAFEEVHWNMRDDRHLIIKTCDGVCNNDDKVPISCVSEDDFFWQTRKNLMNSKVWTWELLHTHTSIFYSPIRNTCNTRVSQHAYTSSFRPCLILHAIVMACYFEHKPDASARKELLILSFRVHVWTHLCPLSLLPWSAYCQKQLTLGEDVDSWLSVDISHKTDRETKR